MKPHIQPQGFIALISAILISSVLLMVMAGGSLMGFYTRGAILDSELKARSTAAADACADVALLSLAQDPNYSGGDVQNLNSLDQCAVVSVTTNGIQKIITIQATSSGEAVTNLHVTYSPNTRSVISWLEVPN